ncbi:hypothetical protein PAN31117_03899 [Pandoraea anapnoica]|uniref:Uncharacterized protein n=1 Tax=Pandoraea anapnoica TaxID=2508301 RepID=A0A5E5AD55_9BURK|nr:hypothetical protein [Pandoraea anapnoica]VVE71027.1 hypothetical protein PAN31117_03899 [Pandoraea anapnoica]
MAEHQSTGELLTNGQFANGDFLGWSVSDHEQIFLARQESGHVAVLMPVPYLSGISLRQRVTQERASGKYILTFWIRTSDKRGNAVPGIARNTNVHLWVHPLDEGVGYWYRLDPPAVQFWGRRVYHFLLEDRGTLQFEIYFNNYNARPDAQHFTPIEREGYEQLAVVDESPELVLPADSDVGDWPYAIRHVSLFKAA